MALAITVRVTIPPLPLLNPTQARAILTQEVSQGMTGFLEDRAMMARAEAPRGATGDLQKSIGALVVPGKDAGTLVQGELFADAPYAEYVAEGTLPHWPPRAPIEYWAERVLGDKRLWFVVARAIARRGTLARFRFRAAFQITESDVEPTIQAAVDRAATRWQGGA